MPQLRGLVELISGFLASEELAPQLLLVQQILDVREGSKGLTSVLGQLTGCAGQASGVLIIVAIQTKEFPVTAIGWVVFVIVVTMMHRKLMQARAFERSAAASADPGKQAQGLFTVAPFTRIARLPRGGDDAIQLGLIRGLPVHPFIFARDLANCYCCRCSLWRQACEG